MYQVLEKSGGSQLPVFTVYIGRLKKNFRNRSSKKKKLENISWQLYGICLTEALSLQYPSSSITCSGYKSLKQTQQNRKTFLRQGLIFN